MNLQRTKISILVVISLIQGCNPNPFDWPKIELPDIKLPTIELPKIEIPKIEFPDIKIPDLFEEGKKILAGAEGWIDQAGQQLKQLGEQIGGDVGKLVNDVGSITVAFVKETFKSPDEWWNQLPDDAKQFFTDAQMTAGQAYEWAKGNAPGLICLANAGVTTASSGPAAPVVGFATVAACVCQFPDLAIVVGIIIYESTKPMCEIKGVPEIDAVCATFKEKGAGFAKDLVKASKCNEGILGGIICVVSVASGTYAAKSNPPLAAIVGTTGFVQCLCGQPEVKAAIENLSCDTLATLVGGDGGEIAKGMCKIVRDTIPGFNAVSLGDVLRRLDCNNDLVAGALCISNQLAGAGTAGPWGTKVALTGIATCVCGKPTLLEYLKNPPICRVLGSIHDEAGKACDTVVNTGIAEVTSSCTSGG